MEYVTNSKEKTYNWEEASDYILAKGYSFGPNNDLWNALHFDDLITYDKTVSQSDLDSAIEKFGEKEVEEKHTNYDTGFFLCDPKDGSSYFRGSFDTVEEAKKAANKWNINNWKVIGFNYDTDKWDVLESSTKKNK